MTEIHPIPPLYSKNSEILILGSFPSVKSRENEFFYSHPQNRFWKVLSAVFNSPLPQNTDEKKELVLKNKLALFDVIKQCDIKGSGDSTIKNVIPNDLTPIIESSNIKHIFLNGKTAEKYYKKYSAPNINIEFTTLPSTSPANAAYSLDRLIEEWKSIDKKLKT